MQIQRVQNNNYNQSFQALRIRGIENDVIYIYHDLHWNALTLDSFVKNKEIQKFVKLLDDMGKDVEAWSHRGDWDKSETDSISLDIIDKKSGKWENSLDLTYDELKNFQPEERIRKHNIKLIKRDKYEKLIEDAKNFVDKFNRSL